MVTSNRPSATTADITKIPLMIGVSIYSFEAIGVIFGIRSSM